MKRHFIQEETYEKRPNHNNKGMQIKTTDTMSHLPVWQFKKFFSVRWIKGNAYNTGNA